MTKFQLYKLLKANSELKDTRHPMFEKNRFMKLLMWFMVLYYAAIMILMGVVLPLAMGEAYNGVAAYHVLDGGFIYLLIVDFWIRFIMQETPAQQVRQYALLPVRRSFLMHIYLLRSGFSLGNLFWGFFLVPFALMSIAPFHGWLATGGWLLGWWMLCILNGFLYLFVRALCMKHMAWFLAPLAVHVALVMAMVWPDQNYLDMPCTQFLNECLHWNPLPFLALIGMIGIAYAANYRLQMGMLYNEVGKKEEVKLKHATQMNFLNRYGVLGEYIKMELKLRLRNKQVRTQFFMGLGMMVFFSAMLYFTDVYDNGFMKSFICLYDYVFFGMTSLITIMCFEGNYIDGLMSRRECIYDLLRAKYYFNCAIVLIPFLFTLPLIIVGKFSIWMSLAYLFFTIGVLYLIFFQLAVYNRNTLPLNQKLTGKQGNTTQQIISVVVLFLPIGVEKICLLLLGNEWGYAPMIMIGMIAVATHQLWLRNIYHRFMARRHYIMEGFRASKE